MDPIDDLINQAKNTIEDMKSLKTVLIYTAAITTLVLIIVVAKKSSS